MKYICTADIHARSARPVYRTDENFLDTVTNKFHQIVTLANINNAYLLIAGDLFHSASVSYEVFNSMYTLLRDVINNVYIVAGQHDLKNHNPLLILSPLYTLHRPVFSSSGKGSIYVMSNDRRDSVYGVQWETPINENTENKDILLTHKCVTSEKPPEFLDKAVSAKKMLKKNKGYQYIVTGDYHISHCTQVKDRFLVNPGSMIRSNIDQADHKPCVYLIDTDKNSVKQIFLNVKPAKEVFNFGASENKNDKKLFQKEMQEFIASLKLKVKDASFRKTLKVIMKQSNTSKEVKKYIKEVIDGCEGV